MEQTTYASRLRYLDADDLDDSDIDFDGLDVRGSDGSKLGDVDGFLVDPAAGRVLYTVVDSGGWFRSRRFLVPIGHAAVDRDARALQVEVARDTLSNYPEFDESKFREFSDADLRAYEHRLAEACCPDETRDASGWPHEVGRHYAQPAWWKPNVYSPDRLRPVDPASFRTRPAATVVGGVSSRDTADRIGDVSPHLGGRAQPGDVLGLETGGETTAIGDTAEDEDKRRRAAERALGTDTERRR